MGNLDGKVAIVSGSGRGIGRAVALKLAANGAAVVVNDLDDGPASETVDAIKKARGRALACNGNVTHVEFPTRFVKTAVESFGGLDIIVNNAGYTWDNVIQKMSDEQWQAIMDVHVTAPFRILRAASEFVRAAAKKEIEEGRRVMRKVVNITSTSGVFGNAGQANYASAKAAVVGLTRCLSKEWGRYNVCVNCVGFGFIETRLTQDLTRPDAKIVMDGREIKIGVQPAHREAIKTICPLGRTGTPEEAAGPVVFFCSPESDYVSGEVLIVAGGLRS